jgi:hypothetical protein
MHEDFVSLDLLVTVEGFEVYMIYAYWLGTTQSMQVGHRLLCKYHMASSDSLKLVGVLLFAFLH